MTEPAPIDKRRQALRLAYKRTFLGDDETMTQDARAILSDLSKFCRLHASTVVVSPVSRQIDPMATLLSEGRREVILRILAHLHISDGDLMRMTQGVE